MSDSECPICNYEKREHLEEELAGGLAKTIVAKEFDCDIDVVTEHMEEHFTSDGVNMSDADGDMDFMISFEERESYEKFDILEKNIRRLVDRFDGLLQRDNYDKSDTDQIVNMAREIRQTAMNMAELEGEIKEELRLTQNQFDELKAVILRELDKESQQKILNVIDEEDISIEGDK